jgi:hypothetical protein
VTHHTVTVRKILQDFKAPPVIHYLSLDVEGSELMVLQTFPFDVHRVLVITIERPDLCVRTILRQHGYLYLRDLQGQDEIWLHPTLPELARKLEKYGRREPRRDDSLRLDSADKDQKCRQMARTLAQGLLQGCCRAVDDFTSDKACCRAVAWHNLFLGGVVINYSLAMMEAVTLLD